jgi:hypothetical protein
MEIVIERDREPVPMYHHLYAQIPKPQLRSAMADCRESDRLELHGYADELNARASHRKHISRAFSSCLSKLSPARKVCSIRWMSRES